jgi:NAD-dependent dihydropyrimidine dehydrogenase PreA subunit
MSKPVYLKDVVTLQLDREACSGCAMCATVCPRGVFEIAHKKAQIADRDSCIECGACALNCPSGAVSVRAGVGCATAVINSMLGIKGDCCCSVDQYEVNEKNSPKGSACC